MYQNRALLVGTLLEGLLTRYEELVEQASQRCGITLTQGLGACQELKESLLRYGSLSTRVERVTEEPVPELIESIVEEAVLKERIDYLCFEAAEGRVQQRLEGVYEELIQGFLRDDYDNLEDAEEDFYYHLEDVGEDYAHLRLVKGYSFDWQQDFLTYAERRGLILETV